MSAELFKTAPDMSCKPDYAQAELDTGRMGSESFFINNILVDCNKTIDENRLFSVYQPIKNEKLRTFFALNNHQNSLYQFLTDIKVAITCAIMNNGQLNDTQKSDIFFSTFEAGVDSLKIEINPIEGSETKYQYTATTKTSGTKKDFFAVSCSVEIDEKNQEIMIKDKKIVLSQEAAGYLGVEKLEYQYPDKISYALNDVTINKDGMQAVHLSNFKELWEEEKNKLINKLSVMINDAEFGAHKNGQYLIEIKKEIENKMSQLAFSLEQTAKNAQDEEEIKSAITHAQKQNSEFIRQLKVRLKSLYPKPGQKKQIDEKFSAYLEQHLKQLNIKSTQPFINKAIDNISKNGDRLYDEAKEKVDDEKTRANKKASSNKKLACDLMEKSNNFYSQPELTSDQLRNFSSTFSQDIQIQEKSLNIPRDLWKPILEYVSTALKAIRLPTAVVDKVSFWIFGHAESFKIADKASKTLKILADKLLPEETTKEEVPRFFAPM